MEAGKIYLLEDGWNKTFLRELLSVPSSKHDDQVDAASIAYSELKRTI